MNQISSTLTRDRIISELRRDILYGVIKPGQELYQDVIANDMGVSRMPVREALQILAAQGFIKAKPNKVATVNEIDQKFIKDYYDVRILLETQAIRLACEAKPDCSAARAAWKRGEQMIAIGDFAAYNDQNRAIHEFIWSAAGNSHLQLLLRQMWHTMDIGNKPEKMASEANQEHLELIDCIENGDTDPALGIIKKHITRSLERTLEIVAHSKID